MYVIGLTGNFGTGKTTVARMLSEHGARLIDADKIGHWLLEQDSQVKKALLEIFSESILGSEGTIDRRKLGKLAFKSRQKTLQLNQIMKPRIREAIQKELEECRKQGVSVLILEAALLVRKDWKNIINEVWVTVAPKNTILNRLTTHRGYAENEVLSRLQRQLSPIQMLNQADLIINTDCSLEELEKRIQTLWTELLLRIESIEE